MLSAPADGCSAAPEETLLLMLCSRSACFAASRAREAPGKIKLREPKVDAQETPLAAVSHDVSHTCTGVLPAAPIIPPIPSLVSASLAASTIPGPVPTATVGSPATDSATASPITSPA